MGSVLRGLLGVLIAGLAVFALSGPAQAAPPVHAGLAHAAPVHAGPAHAAPVAPGTTAQPGPTIDHKDPATQNSANKLLIGVAAVILLVIVYFGRRHQTKHKRRMKRQRQAQPN